MQYEENAFHMLDDMPADECTDRTEAEPHLRQCFFLVRTSSHLF